MTDCSERLVRRGKRPNDCDHAVVEPQIFRRPASGDHEGVVVLSPDFGERGVERKIMSPFFAVGLITLEIVDCGLDLLTGFFARAHRIDKMPDHQHRLERHHYFIILGEVADQKQDLFRCHSHSPHVGSLRRSRHLDPRARRRRHEFGADRIGN